MAEKKKWNCRIWFGAISLVLVLFFGFAADSFAIVSHAQSQGKVTATSAKIRKEPSASSESLGSAMQGDSVTINHQTNGSDGAVWYQVFVNAETKGYIRSDLVSITDGSTPNTVETSASGSDSTAAEESNSGVNTQAQEDVAEVEPVSASVTGGNRVRVRSTASTDSQIVTTVESGAALTVTGQVEGADGKVWYQVEFISNGASVVGFIRSDFVELSSELMPKAEEILEEIIPEEPVVEEETPVIVKDWETQLQGDSWYLLDMVASQQYNIEDLFAAVEQNKAAYEDIQKTAKSQKVVILVLVVLLIVLVAGVAFLILKIKDMKDSVYFSNVEKETMRRRNSGEVGGGARPQNSQKVMHTVGAERRPAGAPSQAQGGRPAGAPSQAQGGRPAGAPGQAQNRRPAGAPGQAQSRRLVGTSSQAQGERPVGAPSQAQSVRPAGAPAQAQSGRPAEMPSQAMNGNRQEVQSIKSRNFMVDDDEFEFEFLNWDGDEE